MSKEQPHPEQSHHDDEMETNTSNNPHMQDLIRSRLSRRDVLKGMSAVSAAFFGASALSLGTQKAQAQSGLTLGFASVAKSLADAVIVPSGHTVKVLYALGDPLTTGIPEYANDGTDEQFDFRAGDHHDGMYYFGMDDDGTPNRFNSDRGMLCLNHEALTTTYLHANGATNNASGVRPIAQARKEIAAHGVSVIEIAKEASEFKVQRGSPRNRRYTAATPMSMRGPARGSAQMITKYSKNGTRTRGTVNNCAEGFTPWGTYLTCEENYAGYFARPSADNANRSAKELTALARDGVSSTLGRHNWASVPGDEFQRWNATVQGATAADDYRNVANTYGWTVEIDPFNPDEQPVKRTALGRFAHEGCWPHLPPREGKPMVFYMGDDARGEYVYKFVSARNWSPKARGLAAGNLYLDSGTLYVAKFSADGSGTWIALVHGQNGLDASNPAYPFEDQADVCIHSRLAGDAVGATRMDRPEWVAVDPTTGLVYLALTNNSNRRIVAGSGQQPVDSANPRDYLDGDPGSSTSSRGNRNGHIIRWLEAGNDPTATSFTWDIYLFGAEADQDPATINLSGLDDSNDFSSPDGLWCDPRGVMWIQTDDGAYTDTTNCMMLAAVPNGINDGGLSGGARPDARAVNGVMTYVAPTPGSDLRRFLVGPVDCEITGVDTTPDGKTMFVNIQHPGEGGSLTSLISTWPAMDGVSRPRSATIVITRDDGGVIGLE